MVRNNIGDWILPPIRWQPIIHPSLTGQEILNDEWLHPSQRILLKKWSRKGDESRESSISWIKLHNLTLEAIQQEGAKSEFSSKYTAASQLSDLLNFTKLRGSFDFQRTLDFHRRCAGRSIRIREPTTNMGCSNRPCLPEEPTCNTHQAHGPPHWRWAKLQKRCKLFRSPPQYLLFLSMTDPHPKLNNFSALVGVYLSDTPEEDSGNFSVFPGTHYQHAEFFKANGGADAIVNAKGMFRCFLRCFSQPASLRIAVLTH